MSKNSLAIFVFVCFIILIITSVAMPEWISPWSEKPIERDILLQLRLPKTLTACFAGIALSISGFILQQLFRNNLAGPYILGVSSGASLAVAFLIIGSYYFPFIKTGLGISLAGFLGALAILLLVLAVSLRFGNGAIILLFGVVIGQVTGALQSILNYLAVPGDLKYFTLWTMGSFSQVLDTDLLVFALSVSVGLIWAWLLMPQLSVMLLGNDVAGTLGVNTKRSSIQLILCTGLLSGVATAYCGPIAFIGMAIPNATRLLIKTADFKYVLLMNALLGACMALISDIVSSIEIFHLHVPVNVSTALIGGPFIVYILLKQKH